MGLSSLWKKMNTSISLVFLFLVGLLSLTFLVFNSKQVNAATSAPIAPTSTSAITPQSVTYNWTATSTFSGTAWLVASSTNRVPTASQIVTSTPTSTVTYTFNGLATNTVYYFGAAGADPGNKSAYATSSPTYTAADTPGTPTLSAATVQGFTAQINSSSNPATTTYIVRDTASSTLTKYLQSDQTWGNATATFKFTQLGPVSGTTTVGLATNTWHRISVAAVNGDSVTTTYGSATDVYTLADTPGTATVTSSAVTTLNVTISAGTNPTTASTTFIVRDTGGASPLYLQSNGTWGSATATLTYAQLNSGSATTTTGLTANTLHTIGVAAVNGDSSATTSYSTSASSYTRANTPSSVSLSAAANGFNLTWSGDATQYYVEDETAGTNSGWITSTNWNVAGVNCGTNHTFRVKGRNGDNTDTSFATSVSATTNACGSGAVISAPAATPAKPAVPGVSPAVPATPATPASVSLPATASPIAVFVHTLRPGTRGGEVKQLQAKLRELGYFKYPTNTGFFGPATRAAVVAFQKAQGLKPYPGHVGPATRAALNSL